MADRFWVAGGDGNWGSTNNWSTTSGGGSGASVPGASDDVYFDGNSGSGTCTLNASGRSCRLFNSVNSTNNTLAGSQALTIGAGGFTLGALFNVTATGLLTLSAASTVTFAGKTWPGTMTFGGSGITITVADTVTVTGLVTFSVGIGATKTIAGAGKVICNGGMSAGFGASSLINCTLTGGVQVTSGTVTMGANGRFAVANVLDIAGNVTVNGTCNVSGIWTQTSGTITWGSTPAIVVAQALTLTLITDFPGSITVAAGITLFINGSIPWTAAASLVANGTSGSLATIRSSTGGVQASQTLPDGMTIDLNYCNLTDIASDKPLYTSRGTLTNTSGCQALNPYVVPFDPLGTEYQPATIFMR